MHALLTVLAQAPAVHPTNPPGSEKIETLINWAAQAAIWACLAALLIGAGSLGWKHSRGTLTPEAGGQIGVVLIAAVLIGVASKIINTLV